MGGGEGGGGAVKGVASQGQPNAPHYQTKEKKKKKVMMSQKTQKDTKIKSAELQNGHVVLVQSGCRKVGLT